ncbi:MAG TPA: hypothetical protein VK981_00080 [Ramlibacter sp.]|nr:hypothetical protein [Ramlibacter sp.]
MNGAAGPGEVSRGQNRGMQKQVILLAGLHKTATTSIQQTCMANQKLLLRAGFSYPVVRARGTTDGNHTFVLKRMFSDAPNSLGRSDGFSMRTVLTAEAIEQRRAEFAAALARNLGVVLLAAEGVSVFSVAELENMKRWFSTHGHALRVICHVRHVAPWVQSMVAQRAVGRMALTIAEAVEEFREAGGIVRPRIEALRATFPDAEFYSHERAVQFPTGPVGFFFNTIGLPKDSGMRLRRANEGRSDIATRALSLLNERFGRVRWQGSAADLQARIEGAGMQAIRAIPGPKFSLQRDEVAPILELIDQENRWLGETLGPEFAGPAPAFATGPRRWRDAELGAITQAASALPANERNWLVERAGSGAPQAAGPH